MSDDTRCRATWWRGCKWQARYDVTPPESFVKALGATPETVSNLLVKATLEGATARRYVRDVCARCGAVRERNDV